jgi:ABC-type glycerol-3-phosphate transport system substrate-binding protein
VLELVALPMELDYGVLFFNQGLLNRYGLQGPPSNFDDMSNMASYILAAEKSEQNFKLSGITGLFSGMTIFYKLLSKDFLR